MNGEEWTSKGQAKEGDGQVPIGRDTAKGRTGAKGNSADVIWGAKISKESSSVR